MKFGLILCVASFGLASSALADDWTQFRGNAGDGHTTANLPTEWSADQHIVWKAEIPGLGWSSPVVVGEMIYLTTAVSTTNTGKETGEDKPAGKQTGKKAAAEDKAPLSLRVIAVNSVTGNIAWNHEVFQTPWYRIHSKNSHASPTPVSDGKRLFVHFGASGTACLSLTGEVLWKQSAIDYRMVHGNGGSPVLVDDLLVFSCDGGDKQFVVALDQSTGKIRWQQPRPEAPGRKKFSFNTPTVIEVDGQQQIVSCGSDLVTGLDPATGKTLWTVNYTGYSVIPKPVFGHGMVFVSTSYDSPELIALKPGSDDEPAEVVWRRKRGAPHTPSMLLVGDELYFVADKGVATCVDAKTGDEHWQQRLGGNFSASPIHSNGRVYFQSEQGVCTVVAAGTEYKELAKNDIQARTLASFGVIDNDLLLRTESQLLRIGHGDAK